jgi:hypothetical protein
MAYLEALGRHLLLPVLQLHTLVAVDLVEQGQVDQAVQAAVLAVVVAHQTVATDLPI